MDLGRDLGSDTLRHALDLCPPGYGLEFGVATGGTLALISEYMPAIGFDSFQGLPEDWRPGFEAGRFACPVPIVNADLVVGLFEDTLPGWTPPGPIGLVHIDCDLYSSTVTVLQHVGQYLDEGCFLVFDEWHGYPGCEQHEQRAWQEYVLRTGVTWTPIGYGPEQFALQLSSPGGTAETRSAEPTLFTSLGTTSA
jgi:hypothetical protein